ncbi:hypothetical protein [Micrococcus luteus]|uniref:hypothetical protein n=1 Tax=Micrococcus luteus TaxID=1270 RepID=UPI002303CE80|nr:hypothetical protein [Micrococcus luteus]
MNDPRETLARIRKQADAATEGPWAPWRDQDGALHMNGLLMVGNAAAVIPEGESWVEGVDVNPIAHTYTPEDREFIAAARTDVPWLLEQIEHRDKALEAVRALHFERAELACGNPTHTVPDLMCPDCLTVCDDCGAPWPCTTVATITTALEAHRG